MGRARIEVELLGDPTVLEGEDWATTMSTGFEPLAHHCTRGWIHSGIRADVLDEQDPTTAWLASSRRPQDLALALRSAQQSAPHTCSGPRTPDDACSEPSPGQAPSGCADAVQAAAHSLQMMRVPSTWLIWLRCFTRKQLAPVNSSACRGRTRTESSSPERSAPGSS